MWVPLSRSAFCAPLLHFATFLPFSFPYTHTRASRRRRSIIPLALSPQPLPRARAIAPPPPTPYIHRVSTMFSTKVFTLFLFVATTTDLALVYIQLQATYVLYWVHGRELKKSVSSGKKFCFAFIINERLTVYLTGYSVVRADRDFRILILSGISD